MGDALRRNLIAGVLLGGILVQLVFCMPTIAADPKSSPPATYSITGTVKDALGRPLKQTGLSLQRSDGRVLARTLSDEAGRFSFSVKARGIYRIEANKAGSKTATRVVSVNSAGATNVEIALQPESTLTLGVVSSRINQQPNGLTKTGNSMYTLNQQEIAGLPQGENTPINQVLLQMPGVVQDDEAQIHVEGEHEDLQWRVNGVMMPMDSFSGFGQIFNSFFVKSVSLLTGVLPVTYGFRDAGVLDLVTKDGCSNPGGNVAFFGGQRETTQPSFEYGICEGPVDFYITGTYLRSNLAFSSATPGPTPYHNITNQGQGFGTINYQLNPQNKLSLIWGVSVNDSEYPSEPGLTPLFSLAGVNPVNYPSVDINESLNQDYYFGILALRGVVGPQVEYQVAFTSAYSTIQFNSDPIGDLIYQGIASNSFHSEWDNSLQTDVSRVFDLSDYGLGSHNLGTGFYLGYYGVELDDTSMTFPGSNGTQTSNIPFKIVEDANEINWLYGGYLQDIWKINKQLTLTAGIRYDGVSGIINTNMPSPRVNVLYQPNPETAFHAGFARYFQTPDFQTISPRSFEDFKDTTAPVSAGGITPFPERDSYWAAGLLRQFGPHLTFQQNAYFRKSHNLIDLGQFGFVPIFTPFNYTNGRIYGSETSASFSWNNLAVRANFTYSSAHGNQLASGQFNFTPAEVAFIKTHYIFLDHSQQYTASGGITYRWNSYLFSVTGLYGSGLRSGFANTDELGENFQIDLGAEKSWHVEGLGPVKTRVMLINASDNINELRNGTGIGIFEPGYGPRRTVYGAISIPLPPLGSLHGNP
jgi:outer membrane receptor protein involved in Fe transport